jgi:hypothetical protein
MERGSWDDPCARATRGLRRPSLDARSWEHPSHPLVSNSSLRPCPRNGASWRAGVGRVRSLAFLSILRDVLLLSQMCLPVALQVGPYADRQTIEITAYVQIQVSYG